MNESLSESKSFSVPQGAVNPREHSPSCFFCLSFCHSCLSEDSLFGGMLSSVRVSSD